MIKLVVTDDSQNRMDFYFENFTYKKCQDLIETCLNQGKTICIWENQKEE